ncbi:GNAT family N-acetyltransferase [Azospirillum sp.]|uniref:GNAT family N-acetyltransferase n=1 Tax=Azospirillum sp. TaxID=34012 RepID=UPI002D2C7B2C|nr:GNAT family N-acetyltransferase [Azospirillum sp.]HYD65418.1 GNAT family N-acetyltransferase [Azospirillum sp.]
MMPTLLPVWIDAFLQHCIRSTDRWFCSFAYAGERLVGVFPVITGPHRILGHRHPVLRTPYDVDSNSGDIPLAADQAAPALRALLAQTRAAVPRHVGIDMKHVRESSPLVAALRQDLDGYLLLPGPVSKGSVIRFAQAPGGRAVEVSRNLRHNLRRARKRLESRGAVAIEIRDGAAATPDFLPEFLAVESSGWKGRRGTAIAVKPDVRAFYTALVENLCAQGRLEWHILRVGGRTVAAGMGVRCGSSLMLPKIGYDEDYADGDPGNLLTDAVIKSALARPGISEINHVSDQTWHRLWHMDQDDYIDATLIRRNALSILFQLLPKRLKTAFRDVRQPKPAAAPPATPPRPSA